MKYKGRQKSTNVRDRRFSTGKKAGGFSIIGIILILLITYLNGGDLGDGLMNVITTSSSDIATTQDYEESPQDQQLVEFISVVLADTEDVWHNLFDQYDRTYHEPTLILFHDQTESGCGYASSQTGPFYCPGDQSVYIDLSFYQELKTRFGVSGDFAMAYVLAHEIGHHVQNELGVLQEVQQARSNLPKIESNELSVRLELQADYLAGVFASKVQAKGYLEEGDLEEALKAANAIGDDAIQKQANGTVIPDSFTHGTSEQRMHWFLKGYHTGDLSDWDTFSTKDL